MDAIQINSAFVIRSLSVTLCMLNYSFNWGLQEQCSNLRQVKIRNILLKNVFAVHLCIHSKSVFTGGLGVFFVSYDIKNLPLYSILHPNNTIFGHVKEG